MEYVLILVITIAGIDYGFITDNTFWSIKECDEKAEEINQSFVSVGTATMKAYCDVQIGNPKRGT